MTGPGTVRKAEECVVETRNAYKTRMLCIYSIIYLSVGYLNTLTYSVEQNTF
jgi:hypothetical protein